MPYIKSYRLKKLFPQEPQPPIGTIWTWNKITKKYTFTYKGTTYSTPPEEVENNPDWFELVAQPPEVTPDVKTFTGEKEIIRRYLQGLIDNL